MTDWFSSSLVAGRFGVVVAPVFGKASRKQLALLATHPQHQLFYILHTTTYII